MKYILSIDQGTSSTRSIIINENGEMIAVVQKEHTQIYPKPSWVEHDPLEIKENVLFTMEEVVKKAKISWKDIEAIGITNQRETVVAWSKITGLPRSNAIVWQCRRTTNIIDELKNEGLQNLFLQKTGLVLDAYFSGTKMKWMMDNIPIDEDIVFGTIDSWIIYFLTGEHRTDASNASRTLLFDLNEMQYSEELADILQIPLDKLPEVIENATEFGIYRKEGNEIPIRGVLGDQQAALFGQLGFNAGDNKTTYGTGNFSLLNIGNKPRISQNGLLTTVGWQFNNKSIYALEGSVFVTGAALQWLRDGIAILPDYSQMDTLANTERDSNGVYFVPAFVGLGAPHWNSTASGSIYGISGGTNIGHIIHATMDSIAYQTDDLVAIMGTDAGLQINSMRVDGGTVRSNLLMQKQADISQIEIKVPINIETTALGAGMMAGYGILWESLDDMKNLNPVQTTFTPKITNNEIERKKILWKKAVEKTKNWY